LRCKPPVVLPPKAVAPASDAGSRPGSSLSGADSAKGRKVTVETGSEPEKVKEIEKPKLEVKRNEDVNGDESPDRSIISRRQRSDSEGNFFFT
jgi:hypothetical protein